MTAPPPTPEARASIVKLVPKGRALHDLLPVVTCAGLDSRLALGQLASMPDPDEYQSRVAAAVMKAIFETSMTEIDGKPTAYVSTVDVMEALVNVMATIMEGAPNCQSSSGIRDMSAAIARKVNVRTREVRTIIQETGRRPFDSIDIRTN